MAKFAALPLFTDAWLADTRHLTYAERGLYHDLLVLCWRSPECRVVADTGVLKHKLGLCDADVPILESIIAEFMQRDGEWVTQKRLQKEFRYVMQKSRKNRVAAKLRWIKEKEAMRTHSERNAPTPTPTPTPTLKGGVLRTPVQRDDTTQAVLQWNQMAVKLKLPQVQHLSVDRKRKLHLRMNEIGGLTGWEAMLDKIQHAAFLQGENRNGWHVTFDWLLQPRNLAKVMEGNYDRGQPQSSITAAFDRINAGIARRADHQSAGPSEPGAYPQNSRKAGGV